MTLRVEWVPGRAGIDELAERWDRLARRAAAPFLQSAWIASWWDAFGNGQGPDVCTVWDGEELHGVLPLQDTGRGLRGMANDHSPSFGPLAADAPTLRALVDAAAARGVELVLPGLPVDDPSIPVVSDRYALTLRGPGYASPAVELHDDFATFRARTKPSWGAPLERFRRKMGRDHVAEERLVERPTDLERELDECFRVEASGWKGDAGTAIVSHPSTWRFYRHVARRLAPLDQLRLNAVRLDGQLVAWDLCVLFGGRLHLLKTGYDERFRRYAPGLVMRLSVIERCYELGLASHELGGGDDPWKRKFATTYRQHTRLRAYPARSRAALRFARDSSLEATRRAYRRVRPRA